MSIRIANQNDVSKIRSLVISLAHFYLESIESELPDWFAETLTERAFLNRVTNEEYQNFVYEVQGEIAGYLALKGDSHLYTHATSICKVSKENCAEIPGIKLKPSHSKSIFYNDVDGCKLPCPTGRKLENQPSVTTSEK